MFSKTNFRIATIVVVILLLMLFGRQPNGWPIYT